MRAVGRGRVAGEQQRRLAVAVEITNDRAGNRVLIIGSAVVAAAGRVVWPKGSHDRIAVALDIVFKNERDVAIGDDQLRDSVASMSAVKRRPLAELLTSIGAAGRVTE